MKSNLETIFYSVASVAILLFCNSCVEVREPETTRTAIQTPPNLVYVDHWLKSAIPCEAITAQQLPSGRVLVHTSFVNAQNETAECQIEFRFLDANGQILDDTGWMPFVLPRREIKQFDYTSLTTGAKDFLVMVREAKGE